MKNKLHKWRKEHVDFLRKEYPGRTQKEIHKLFNDYFGLDLTFSQITSSIHRYKLTNGLHGKNQFKKGYKPSNILPIGTEKIRSNDFLYVKVSDTGVERVDWRPKHRVIFEEQYGEIPKGYKVMFLDGDNRNLDIDNLHLISEKVSPVLNRHGYFEKGNPEMNKVAIAIAETVVKINAIEREMASE